MARPLRQRETCSIACRPAHLLKLSSPKLAPSWSGVERGMMTKFEAVLAALLARDNLYPSNPEQKNMVKAEYLHGAAAAFALCWRGEESSQCLEAAKELYDQINSKSPDQAARPASSMDTIECDNPALVRRSRRKP